MSDVLKVEEIGDIRRVTMNRPERLNALNQTLTEELLHYFEARRRDTGARVIIVTGAGRGFTAGADLKAMGQPDALKDGPHGDWYLRDLMKAMRGCPQPIVTLVKGPAAGGGLAIALASDVVVAGESAVFHTAFIKIGLTGAELGAAWRMQRTMGLSRAREAMLTGRPIDAQDALRTGLVSSVVADDKLEAHGLELAQAMCAAQPDALRLTKRTLDAALEIGSFDAAMELEERAQMLMIARRPRPA